MPHAIPRLGVRRPEAGYPMRQQCDGAILPVEGIDPLPGGKLISEGIARFDVRLRATTGTRR